MNVTDALDFSAEKRIKIVKEEACTNAFNQVYDKLQAKKNKAQTRQLLELAWQKVHGQINQWQFIMIIYKSIQKIPAKLWTDPSVAVNLHPHYRLYFSGLIKKIAPAVRMGEIAYFRNHEGYYYGDMPYVWKNIIVIKRR